MAGDDPAVVADLVDRFLEEAPRRLSTVGREAATGDVTAAADAAATLASLASLLGADEVARIGAELEVHARAGRADLVEHRMADAAATLDALTRGLAEARAGGWPGG
jgi:HPt (histidine-containing phosphotransfer) domain-containing protein